MTIGKETERGRFRLTPHDRIAIEEILNITRCTQRADAVRSAISAAHQLFRLGQKWRIVLRNESLKQQTGLYVGPGGGAPDEPLAEVASGEKGILEVRLSATDAVWLDSLVRERFGSNRTQVVKRSIHLFAWLLNEVRDGWKIGRILPDGVFIEDQLREFEPAMPSTNSQPTRSMDQECPSAETNQVLTITSPPFVKPLIDDHQQFIKEQQFLIGRAHGNCDIWVLNPNRHPILREEDFVWAWSFNISKGVVYKILWVIEDTNIDQIRDFFAKARQVSLAVSALPQEGARKGGIEIIPLFLGANDANIKAIQSEWKQFDAESSASPKRTTPERRYLMCEPPINLENSSVYSPEYNGNRDQTELVRLKGTLRAAANALLNKRFTPFDSVIAYLPLQSNLIPTCSVTIREIDNYLTWEPGFVFMVEPKVRSEELRERLLDFGQHYLAYWSVFNKNACRPETVPMITTMPILQHAMG